MNSHGDVLRCVEVLEPVKLDREILKEETP